MDMDELFRRYFGTADLAEVAPSAMLAGKEKMLVDLGLETDRNKKFALWSVLFTLGDAPDLDVAFEDEVDRDAARNLMDLLAAAQAER
ncbi:hypothetical protein [Paraurantiacibacter namhicola]|uniref:Uncharacterized protein n=1 Tax=Paraurantiacibacter namhicola TaxID=645517 RepID=A0A1C7D6X4_9SPHN|nr:hypothetical protein [Paraurantiacibacter namhicola]ANU07198.1 hypothetical protein A6F65_00887 [Paraurantiacibacter namhicola]